MDNVNVHRAAANIIISKSRAARGSVCNVLLSRVFLPDGLCLLKDRKATTVTVASHCNVSARQNLLSAGVISAGVAVRLEEQVLEGESDREKSYQCAANRRFPLNHVGTAVWAFHTGFRGFRESKEATFNQSVRWGGDNI